MIGYLINMFRYSQKISGRSHPLLRISIVAYELFKDQRFENFVQIIIINLVGVFYTNIRVLNELIYSKVKRSEDSIGRHIIFKLN